MLNPIVKVGLAFGAGVAIGAAGSYILCKSKNEVQRAEEVESVHAAYRAMMNEKKPEGDKMKKDDKQEEVKPEKDIPELPSAEHSGVNYTKYVATAEAYVHVPAPRQVIDPKDIPDDYTQFEYYYFVDGTVTDSDYRKLSENDISEAFGRDKLSHIGDYEDDSVFIKDDSTKSVHIVYAEPRSYEEYKSKVPYAER